MVRTAASTVSLLVLLLLLSACGGADSGGSGEPTGKPTEQPEASSPAVLEPTPIPTRTATETPAPRTELIVGDTATTPAGKVLTVYSYETPIAHEYFAPNPGNVFAIIDVEACTSADLEEPVLLIPYFQLQMSDNTSRAPDLSVKEPALNATTLMPGECVRGFVTFQIPAGVTPAFVVFEAYDEPNLVEIKWAV